MKAGPDQPSLGHLPGGGFMMGSAAGREEEAPAHWVELSPFYMGRFAVTNQEYGIFLHETARTPPPSWGHPSFGAPRQPVVSVNWYDATDYCSWLSEKLGFHFRLPTEAEREFACRGGTTSAYPWGDSPERELQGYGCCWFEGGTAPVGGPPNPLGLYNLADNVHEWCLDWYDAKYYEGSPENNPTGPAEGRRRASRGGSWRHQIKVTRSAARSSLPPYYCYADYGFRVVRALKDDSSTQPNR